MMKVRKATIADLGILAEIYAMAKERMRAEGNICQWTQNYPSVSILSADIEAGNSYIVESDGVPAGAFSLIMGADSTYAQIDGRWLNDEPYATIHRLGANGVASGVADCCLRFSLGVCRNLRVDTHAVNTRMRRWVESRGFLYCGVIRIADGSPRMAFQLCDSLS